MFAETAETVVLTLPMEAVSRLTACSVCVARWSLRMRASKSATLRLRFSAAREAAWLVASPCAAASNCKRLRFRRMSRQLACITCRRVTALWGASAT